MSTNNLTLTNDSGDLLVNYKKFLPCGSIVNYAGSTAPSGWLICDGTELSISMYPDLFNIIGYTYGNDTSGYFCLPDLQERVPVGKTSNTTLGATGGNSDISLNVSQMPLHSHSATVDAIGAHTHGITDNGHNHTQLTINDDYNNSGGNTYPENSNPSFAGYDMAGSKTWNNISTAYTGISINQAGSHSHGITIGNEGSGQSIDIRNKYIVLNYIIKH